MTSTNEKQNRANIRIEIKNDISETEAMDIDMTPENNGIEAEIEDGEISDGKENDDIEDNQSDILLSNRTITLQKNEKKITIDRRLREDVDFFDTDKLETRAKRFGLEAASPETISMTDKQVVDLHDSLGITEEERINIRFDAIHMYGTQDMSIQDIFAYFGKYSPSSVEWINDESCNVIWLDTITPGRALNDLSRVITDMPVRGACDPFKNDFEQPKQQINVKKNNSTSILLLDDATKRDNNTINVSDLNFPIPPGYWRLGDSYLKAKYIILRYAKRTDKKPLRAEKFSELNKKYDNPNYSRIKGIISESKKARMKGETTNLQKSVENMKGNPWGRLAKDWNKDILERPMEEVQSVPYKSKASKSLLNRLGTTKKRSISPVNSEEEDKEHVAKKSKVPRMRMYADEEEARITKVKELKKIRALEKIEENILENHVPDLRSRLKNQQICNNETNTKKPLITSRLRLHPIKQEIKVTAKNDIRRIPSETESSDDELNVKQRSKVTVIVKKQNKPTVASTIWSRLADEKNKKLANRTKKLDSNSSSSSSSDSNSTNTNKSDSDSESDIERNDFAKTLNPRPGFHKDLKSRLGLNNSEHKSPLRIEINNDHYKTS